MRASRRQMSASITSSGSSSAQRNAAVITSCAMACSSACHPRRRTTGNAGRPIRSLQHHGLRSRKRETRTDEPSFGSSDRSAVSLTVSAGSQIHCGCRRADIAHEATRRSMTGCGPPRVRQTNRTAVGPLALRGGETISGPCMTGGRALLWARDAVGWSSVMRLAAPSRQATYPRGLLHVGWIMGLRASRSGRRTATSGRSGLPRRRGAVCSLAASRAARRSRRPARGRSWRTCRFPSLRDPRRPRCVAISRRAAR